MSEATKKTEQEVQIELSILLPEVPDEQDQCVERLLQAIGSRKGVARAHVVTEDGGSALCVHYDPEVVGLATVRRIAEDAGAQVSNRFLHRRWRITGMDCADCAESVEHILGHEDGVLAVHVNPASEKIWVEFDSETISEKTLQQRIHGIGYGIDTGEKHSWLSHNWELLLAIASGVFLAAGFFGQMTFNWPQTASVLLYAVAYVSGGFNATRHGLAAAFRLRFDIDFLMVVAAIGAAILGEYAEGALLLFLFSLGHALEHQAMDRARSAISALGELTPSTARLADNEGTREVPVDELQLEQTVLVRAGERLPVDGIVLDGESAVDQSPVTGESVPVDKSSGDTVFAGSVNGDRSLRVMVTKLAKDTTLARVIEMVEEAEAQQSPSQRFTDRFTRIFVPGILVVVVLLIVAPPLAGLLSWAEAFLRGMTVLVAASPCALAISTPAAVLSGVARAARAGILVKGGMHLENLGTLRSVAFDKTGTITTGTFDVVDVVCAEGISEVELLAPVAAVETGSSHPLAEAIGREAQERSIDVPDADGITTTGGRGVTGSVNGTSVRVGNRKLFEERKLPPAIQETLERLESEGKSCMVAMRDEQVLGVIALRDRPRENAKQTISALRRLGIERTVLLTGDNDRVAKAVAAEAGIDDYRAGLLPEQKVTAIEELKSRYGHVAMVGDGVNDAPALATSTVGIAMGAGGADVALESADVALMGDDLSRLRFAIHLSRRSRRTIVQNIVVSLGVIGVLVVGAITGVASIAPAIVAHEGSTLIVVANALRLLGLREG